MTALPMIDVAPVRHHFDALLALGVPQTELQAALGASSAALDERDGQIAFSANLRLLAAGEARLGRGAMLALGAGVTHDRLGICGRVIACSATLGDAAEQLARYQQLIFGVSRLEVARQAGTVTIHHVLRYPVERSYRPLLTELNLAGTLAVARALTGKPIAALRVQFRHRRGAALEAYVRVFGCRPVFGARADRMDWDAEVLAWPLRHGDRYLQELLAVHADRELRKRSSSDRFSEHVAQAVVEALPRRSLGADQIASQLGISRWTLTRRLKNEGTDFQRLVTEVRKRLSREWVRDPRISVSEIAFLLGYSDLRAFRRAYKTWFGQPPRGSAPAR